MVGSVEEAHVHCQCQVKDIMHGRECGRSTCVVEQSVSSEGHYVG